MGIGPKRPGFAKSSDSVRNRQRYPQAHLRFEFAGSDLSFASLDLNLFVAGELEIISDCRTGKVNCVMPSIFVLLVGRKIIKNLNIQKVLLPVHTLPCDILIVIQR